MFRKGIVLGALALVAGAQAGTLSANYTSVNPKSVQFVLNGAQKNLTANEWSGHRTGGTDNRVSSKFIAFCVEITEYIDTSKVNTHASVTDLLNSTTNAGGVNFDATRTKNLETLFGSYLGSVNSADTTAAFQLAAWEIAFDTDLSLTNKNGKMYGVDRNTSQSGIQLDAVSTISQTWLSSIKSGAATKRTGLLLLSGKGVQDLVTPVPEPMTMLVLGAGAAFAARRRKKA
ncbi:MAG: PEP-CTERM sorting domain-containing protein [Armatimonadetes bacterium]|nr:PEP-CTERM sorting domain-containing protein [Armatimonadota bacterium]